MNNLFCDIPAGLEDELFETLASSDKVVVERIVSTGQASPAEGWYDQDRNEFVVVLRGSARLEYEDGSQWDLATGDWVDSPAHRKHRVAWTDQTTETVWLAVHYE